MKKVKVPRNIPCPCGSNLKYKNCCLHQNIQWGINSNGGYYRLFSLTDNIDAIEEVSLAFDMQAQRFREIMGREPYDDDYIFFDKNAYCVEESLNNISDAMKEIGLDPELVYAVKKTGMFVTDYNKSLFTGKEIQEWNEAINEYYTSHKESETNNMQIKELYNELVSIIVLYGIVLDKKEQFELPIQEMTRFSYNEYVLYCLAKSLKTIKTIMGNIERGFKEDSFILVRSLYENYLFIIYSFNEPEKIQEFIQAKIGLDQGTYVYAKNKKGEDNKRIIKEKSTGKEVKGFITAYDIASSSKYNEDILLFDHIYAFLSQYTHPDINSIENYLKENKFDGTVTSNTEIVAILTIFFASLILAELLNLKHINEIVQDDIIRINDRINNQLKIYLSKNAVMIKENDISDIMIARVNDSHLQKNNG